mgnify:CR=1 FL=1
MKAFTPAREAEMASDLVFALKKPKGRILFGMQGGLLKDLGGGADWISSEIACSRPDRPLKDGLVARKELSHRVVHPSCPSITSMAMSGQ